MGGACDLGFGNRYRAVQDSAVRRLFAEELPKKMRVEEYTCTGYTDFTITARFETSPAEAQALVAALEKTFVSQQNHPVVSDAQKRRKQIGPPTHSTYVFYLPGVEPLHDREVSVTLQKDPKLPATVEFKGGRY